MKITILTQFTTNILFSRSILFPIERKTIQLIMVPGVANGYNTQGQTPNMKPSKTI